MAGAHVGDVEANAQQLQLRVEGVARQVEDLHRLLHPLEREVLRLGGEDRVRRGDQRVHRHQAEGGGAVDQDQVLGAPQVPQRVAKRHLAPDLPRQDQLGLGEAEVRRHHPAVHGVGGARLSLEDVAERRVGVRVGVEVVGEVALRVGVDRHHVHPQALEDVRQRADHGRLSGAPLLGQNGDRFGHRPDYMAGAHSRRRLTLKRRRRLYTARPFCPRRAPARRRRGNREVRLLSSSSSQSPLANEQGRFSPERAYRPRVSPPSVEDRDACAIYASVRKDATPSRAPVELALANLQKMLHRAGNVDGEGDGCGILVDIPRKIWAEEVRSGGHNPALALDPAFAVAHVFIERSADVERARHDAREILGRGGFRILAERLGVVDSQALGATAREEEPHFWQVAGLLPDAKRRERLTFDLMSALETELRLPPGVVLGLDLRLQGDGGAEGARRVLPRPPGRAVRDDRLLRPQPLLDQHLAVVQARAAVHGPGPQRRDQHDRAAPPGGGACSASRSRPAAPTPRT